MWDKWFRQWLEAIFWWLPSRERSQQGPTGAPRRAEATDKGREASQARKEESAPQPREEKDKPSPQPREEKDKPPPQPREEKPAPQSKKSAAKTPKKPRAKASATSQKSPAKSASGRAQPKGQPKAQPDDLTAIKGLGPAMQRKLADIGITTFKELAEADAHSLTDQLKASQRTVTREKVQAWMTEARKHQGG